MIQIKCTGYHGNKLCADNCTKEGKRTCCVYCDRIDTCAGICAGPAYGQDVSPATGQLFKLMSLKKQIEIINTDYNEELESGTET